MLAFTLKEETVTAMEKWSPELPSRFVTFGFMAHTSEGSPELSLEVITRRPGKDPAQPGDFANERHPPGHPSG